MSARPQLVTCPQVVSLAGPDGDLGCIAHGAVLLHEGLIQAVGPEDQLRSQGLPQGTVERKLGFGLLMPGLVDCHTHMIWAGERSGEWEQGLAGVHYSQILEQGGGILATVAATRNASDEQLKSSLRARLDRCLQRGIVCVEVKSGYGLSHEQELRLLDLVGQVGQEWPGRLVATCLAAHAIPPEGDREGYVETLIARTIPEIAQRDLARFVDVYCDRGAYTLDESRRILQAAKDAGLEIRAHAEQIEHTGIAAVAAQIGARFVDHLERIDQRGIEALALAGTRAVLLPGARFFLRDSPPPARELAQAGIPLAIGTDWNPGSSPTGDLLLMALMACQDMGLTLSQAIRGITEIPRTGLGEGSASLRAGGPADLAWFDAREPAALVQQATEVRCLESWVAGETIWAHDGGAARDDASGQVG